MCCIVFFFNDTATTEIYTLSLHDALPILSVREEALDPQRAGPLEEATGIFLTGGNQVKIASLLGGDRKSTRLNSSHANISYAVFCLKKKKKMKIYMQAL